MRITQEELFAVSKVPGVSISDEGLCVPPSATPADKEALIDALLSIESKTTNWIRFELGKLVLSLPDNGGKLIYCKARWGEARGRLIMNFAWITRRWAWNTTVPWSWSFYKASANAPRSAQKRYIELFKQGKLTIAILVAQQQQRKRQAGVKPNSTWSLEPPINPAESTFIISPTNTNVDSVQAYLQFDQTGQRLLVFSDDETLPPRAIEAPDMPALVSVAFSVATPQQRRQYHVDLCRFAEEEDEE